MKMLLIQYPLILGQNCEADKVSWLNSYKYTFECKQTYSMKLDGRMQTSAQPALGPPVGPSLLTRPMGLLAFGGERVGWYTRVGLSLSLARN